MRAKDYPLPTVEIGCNYCSRYGRYRKQRFVEIVGADTELPQALGVIAADCPEDRVSPDNMRGNCRQFYAQIWWIAGRRER
ncbi:hypothetical protein RA25_02840 [Leisingera sp. ANG-S5]|nr:hypothetical protein RA25_02840 [Leisingera sp. ANG-S5]